MFLAALDALNAQLDAADQEQLNATMAWLAEREHLDTGELEAAARRAITAECRQVCAITLPDLMHVTAEQLADVRCHPDAELNRRRDQALDLAMQAPRSLLQFRASVKASLQAAADRAGDLNHQQALAAQALRTIEAGARSKLSKQQRHEAARLRRVQAALAEQVREHNQQVTHLAAQLDVITATEQVCWEWANDPERSVVLAGGAATMKVLAERRVPGAGSGSGGVAQTV
jgi:hypothetical protein